MSQSDESEREFSKPRDARLTPRIVLVVESNRILRLCLVNLIANTGLKVLEAGDADEAIAVLGSSVEIALVITNIGMSGSMDGAELARAVDNQWPSVKIIVVSGKHGASEVDLPSKCLFFAKPYHDDEILFEIRSLMGA